MATPRFKEFSRRKERAAREAVIPGYTTADVALIDDLIPLGGGQTDLHLVYEGLSRVDADAVMAGSTTARGRDMVFSVWHPELVTLRLARGRPRHPAQVVVTRTGDVRFDDARVFLEPELRVFVITQTSAVMAVRARINGRGWIERAAEARARRRAGRDLRAPASQSQV